MKQITGSMKKFIGAAALASLITITCAAQQADPVRSSFEKYSQNTIHEKVFAHTDKSAYLTGEILWFKLYVVDATGHKPIDLSKVAYVDVLDNNSVPVLQTKVELTKGSGSGSIYIPVTVANGSYKLRAYTNWMKNFSPDYYFEKAITIVNPQIVPGAIAGTGPAFDIQFFPEGGNLLNGIATRVAFKAVGKDGKGIDFAGALVNQKNDTLLKFKPLQFGMGSFTFTPDASSTYKAVIRSGQETPVVIALPSAASQGYALQLTDQGSRLTVSVKAQNVDNTEGVYLFVHTGQLVKVAKYSSLNNSTAVFNIDKSQLDEGISHFTLFNNNHRPVAERLYFKRPTKLLHVDATTDQQQYANRKKVSVSLSAKDNAGNQQVADLSVSVYRLDDFQTADESDIAAYFWLSSDLKGRIESPGYYLKENSDESADNLMLTQGWSRFQWNDVLGGKTPVFSYLPEYNGHLVSGKVINTLTNAPAADVVAYLGVPGKRVQLFSSRSDSSGRVIFNTKDLYGPGEIVVQSNTEHDSTYRIDIMSPFSEQYSKTPLPPFSLKQVLQPAVENASIGMQVLNLYSGNSIKKYAEAVVDSNGFYGKPYRSYKLDDYTRFTTMEEVLREYIHELYVVKSDKRFHIKIISEKGFLDGDPLVLLDGVPVFNMDKVVALDPLKIKKLDVVRDRYFWGPTSFEGILSYTTYKGDLGGLDLDPHAVVLDYEGLQLQRVFYSPVYGTEAEVASRLPDFRNLLYWAPFVKSSSQGNTQFSFYTGDQPGKYIGIIQGLTADGTAGGHVFNFDVK